MKAIIQRVLKSNVLIDNEINRSIDEGLMVLIGFTHTDSIDDINYIINKIINLRIFEKDNKMSLSVKDINGSILIVSQFTLFANCKRGNRPSFTNAMEPIKAKELYDIFSKKIKEYGVNVEFGNFGSKMEISLINNGPVTIILDSKER